MHMGSGVIKAGLLTDLRDENGPKHFGGNWVMIDGWL